jgi:crotonobetainyl-CoA:carnitine CoA-transferase CaiB-like acyl-CoA transferase
MAQYALSGVPAQPMPNRMSAWAIYDVFVAKDGQQVFVGVVTDTQWEMFCKAFELPDWFADERLRTNTQRVHARAWLLPMAAEVFARYDKAELMEKCERTGLPYAPITRPEELFDDPHLAQSGGLLPISLPDGRQTVIPALPLEMDGHRFGVRLDVPEFAEHTRPLLAELGYDAAEIDRLVADGIVAAGSYAAPSSPRAALSLASTLSEHLKSSSSALCRGSTPFGKAGARGTKDVDARAKPEHDDLR